MTSLPRPSAAVRAASLLLAGCLALAAAGCGEQAPAGKGETGTAARTGAAPVGKGFDFYVLSLSWSPTWCAENDAAGRTEQCRKGGDHGFIVHGLWPQHEHGYPEFCPTRQPDRVPDALGRSVMDIIPSMGLVGHQWRKHGSCSGLTQKDYFAVTRAARERVTIPESLARPRGGGRLSPQAVEKAFVAANPGLVPEGIAVACEAGRLAEVRLCLTPKLSFRPCPEVDRAGCRAANVEQLPIR